MLRTANERAIDSGIHRGRAVPMAAGRAAGVLEAMAVKEVVSAAGAAASVRPHIPFLRPLTRTTTERFQMTN